MRGTTLVLIALLLTGCATSDYFHKRGSPPVEPKRIEKEQWLREAPAVPVQTFK